MAGEMEFRLPDVGEGIDAGEIVAWHVAEGDDVREDQPLADVQTDKAVVAIPCPTSGTVTRLGARVGESVAVGAVLAVFAPAGAKTGEGAGEGPPVAEAPAAKGSPGPAEPARAAASADAMAPVGAAGNGAPPASVPAPRPLASPAVRKLAREAGVALADVAGSGPGGRIVRADVEAAGGGTTAAQPAAAPTPALPASPAGEDRVIALRGVRRSIARTLTHAWQTIPHVIDFREVDATQLVRARRALKERARRAGDERLAAALTITPLIVKIAVHALRRHPYVNASIDLEREEIVLRGAYNLGIATAAPDGLVVPVVHGAEAKTVAEIALEVADLSAAAREQRLAPEQLAGGTFTVNNYGGLGIWLGTPIIKPPEVANLGVGRLQDRPVAVDGEVVVRPIIALAVSGDHRILDGHTLGAFVSDVVELMEDPYLLLQDAR